LIPLRRGAFRFIVLSLFNFPELRDSLPPGLLAPPQHPIYLVVLGDFYPSFFHRFFFRPPLGCSHPLPLLAFPPDASGAPSFVEGFSASDSYLGGLLSSSCRRSPSFGSPGQTDRCMPADSGFFEPAEGDLSPTLFLLQSFSQGLLFGVFPPGPERVSPDAFPFFFFASPTLLRPVAGPPLRPPGFSDRHA